MVPKNLRYAETHEWVSLDGDIGTVGITRFAVEQLTDVVFVELPKEGCVVKKKESAMVIESVKAAFDIYAPMSGKIIKVNDLLKDKPETVNKSPYEQGWLFQIECSDPKEFEALLTQEQYLSAKDAGHSS